MRKSSRCDAYICPPARWAVAHIFVMRSKIKSTVSLGFSDDVKTGCVLRRSLGDGDR